MPLRRLLRVFVGLQDAAAAAGTGSITAADWSVRSVAEIQAAIKAKVLRGLVDLVTPARR